MKLIQTQNGYVNAAHVVRLTRRSGGQADVKMVNGSEEVSIYAFDDVVDMLNDVIPNTTDICAVQIAWEDDKVWHQIVPIIGWSVASGIVIGILADGSEAEFLIYPSGRVEHVNIQGFDSLADALKDFQSSKN